MVRLQEGKVSSRTTISTSIMTCIALAALPAAPQT
jgi:hypothetical protein